MQLFMVPSGWNSERGRKESKSELAPSQLSQFVVSLLLSEERKDLLTPDPPNRHLPSSFREGFQLTALALAKDLTRVMAALSLKTVKKKTIFGTCLLFLLASLCIGF
jgi:hypothetical protein